MRRRQGTGKRGYTLLEMLVAITIIIILATAGTFVTRHAMAVSNIKKTQAILMHVAGAATKFKIAAGRFPTAADTDELYRQLVATTNGGPFLESDFSDFCERDSGGTWHIQDAWGVDLRYEVVAQTGGQGREIGVRVTSAGYDGQFGTDDDLYSTTN